MTKKKKAVVIGGYFFIVILVVAYLCYRFMRGCSGSPLLDDCTVFICIFLIAMVLPLIIYGYFAIRGYSFEKVFLISAISWGIVFQIIVPPLTGTDEWIHFKSAYWTSDRIMGTTTEENTVLMREQDTVYSRLAYSKEALLILANESWINHGSETMVSTDEWRIEAWYRYIPSAIGITIARLLHLGSAATIYLGRLVNLLLFVGIGFWCVKILPIGKPQMVSITMIPLLMQQVTGYTYDGLSIIFSIFMISLCLYYAMGNKNFLSWFDVCLLLLSLAVLAANKGVYVFFVLLVFLIPKEKVMKSVKSFFTTTKSRVITVLVCVSLLIVGRPILNRFLVYVKMALFRNSEQGIEQAPEYMAWTMSYASEHIGETINLFANTLKSFSSVTIRMMGENLGGHVLNIPMPVLTLEGILVVIILQILYHRGQGINKKKKIICFVTFSIVLFAILIGCMVRFTAVGAGSIDVSVRYYLPLFSCVLIACGTNKVETEETLFLFTVQHILMIIICMNMFVSMYGIESATALGLM